MKERSGIDWTENGNLRSEQFSSAFDSSSVGSRTKVARRKRLWWPEKASQAKLKLIFYPKIITIFSLNSVLKDLLRKFQQKQRQQCHKRSQPNPERIQLKQSTSNLSHDEWMFPWLVVGGQRDFWLGKVEVLLPQGWWWNFDFVWQCFCCAFEVRLMTRSVSVQECN